MDDLIWPVSRTGTALFVLAVFRPILMLAIQSYGVVFYMIISNQGLKGWELLRSQILTLSSFLFEPKLSYNLLSINKISRDQNHPANFVLNHCVFQHLESERMIGSANNNSSLPY